VLVGVGLAVEPDEGGRGEGELLAKGLFVLQYPL
jgi:hypothetical protein